MDTGTFIQQENQSYTSETKPSIQQKGYKFSKPEIKFTEEKHSLKEIGTEEAPEMTEAQWKKYYKKMGLE